MIALLVFLLPYLITAAVSVGIAVIHAALFGPKPIHGQQLKNKTVSTSSYGVPWPRCRGSVRLSGNMIWSSAIKETVRKTTSGGIFGIGQQAVYTYSYSADIAIGFGYRLAMGPASQIMRIYADGKFLYNARASDAYLTGQVLRGPTTTGSSYAFIITNTSSATFHVNIGDQIVFPETPNQIYTATTSMTLGPNSNGFLGIYPPAVQDYGSTSVITALGLSITPAVGDTDSDDYVGTIYDNSSFDPDPSDGSHLGSGGYIPHQGGIRFYLGTTAQNPDPLMVAQIGNNNVPGYRNLVYAMIFDLELANYGNRIPNISAEIDFDPPGAFTISSTVGTLALSDVVTGLMTEAGYAANQYDVTALANTFMVGYEADQEDYQASLRRLMALYVFSSAEIDGVITFKFHDGLPSMAIPFDDLGALADHTQQEPRITETITDEQDVPETVWVRYYEPSKQFQPAAQYDKRISQPYANNTAVPVTNSRKQLTIDMPITDTAQSMRQQAQKILYDFWSSRTMGKFKLPQKYMQLDPTDIIEIPYYNDTVVVRLSQVDRGAGWPLQLEGVAHEYHQSVATSHGGGGSGGKHPPEAPPLPCTLTLLDVPFLEDADVHAQNTTGIYWALEATLNTTPAADQLLAQFHGGSVYRSKDDVNFDAIGSSSNSAFNGTALNILPYNVIPGFVDSTVLRITPTMGWFGTAPVTVTDDALTNGHQNLCALINKAGEIELIQCRDVSVNGDGSYSFSHIVRGVRGTETMSKHAIGDLFVLLTNNYGHADLLLGDKGKVRYYTAISSGLPLQFTTPAPIQETLIPRDLMPYAPINIVQTPDSRGNIFISWTRRTRYGGVWVDGTSGPLNEAFEEYEVDITSAIGAPAVRTIKTNVPTIIYNVTQQKTDFGGPVASIFPVIYQISALVGRGFPGTMTGTSTPSYGPDPYVIAFDYGDLNTPKANEMILEHKVAAYVSGIVVPLGFTGSVAGCRIAASGTYVIAIYWSPGGSRPGIVGGGAIHIADLTYAPGSLDGQFSFNGATVGNHDFATTVGDLFQFVAPAAPDATLSGMFWTVSCRRLNSMPATVGN